jgi:hypothetical protein
MNKYRLMIDGNVIEVIGSNADAAKNRARFLAMKKGGRGNVTDCRLIATGVQIKVKRKRKINYMVS